MNCKKEYRDVYDTNRNLINGRSVEWGKDKLGKNEFHMLRLRQFNVKK